MGLVGTSQLLTASVLVGEINMPLLLTRFQLCIWNPLTVNHFFVCLYPGVISIKMIFCLYSNVFNCCVLCFMIEGNICGVFSVLLFFYLLNILYCFIEARFIESYTIGMLSFGNDWFPLEIKGKTNLWCEWTRLMISDLSVKFKIRYDV